MTPSHNIKEVHAGFTLVELVITVALIGLISFTLFPHITTERGNNETLLLQRSIYEAMDVASSGYPLRFIIDTKGKLKAEVLAITEDLGEQWNKLELKWLPGSSGWKSEATVFYIYPDGTCSPWHLVLEKKDYRTVYLVSVTGHVYEIKGSP